MMAGHPNKLLASLEAERWARFSEFAAVSARKARRQSIPPANSVSAYARVEASLDCPITITQMYNPISSPSSL